MTDDEEIEFYRLKTARDSLMLTVANLRGQLETIAAHEREECAKICDRFQARDVGMQPAECAGAIRARSKHD